MTGEEAGAFHGPFVVIRPIGMGYEVTVNPPLPDGQDRTRTFATKHDAWGYASGIWREWHLPVRDLTEGNTGRSPRELHGRKTSFSLK